MYWRKDLEKDFLFAGWTIACHNIYKIQPFDEDEVCYRHFGLEKLISPKRLISIQKSPMLFLLCLVDTIEPVKYFKASTILNSINMEIIENKLSIDLLGCNNDIRRYEYMGKLNAMNTWLTDVELSSETKATIILNPNKNILTR